MEVVLCCNFLSLLNMDFWLMGKKVGMMEVRLLGPSAGDGTRAKKGQGGGETVVNLRSEMESKWRRGEKWDKEGTC